MTQAELGSALGWGDKGANRLAQYETNYQVPRKDLVTEMAKILDVNPLTLHDPTTMDVRNLSGREMQFQRRYHCPLP